jgi:hypothetical protein
LNTKKQKRIINNLLNSPDLLSQSIDIIKPSYFDPEYIPHVKFLIEYHLKHNSNPNVDLMNAEVDTDDPYESYKILTDEQEHTAEELEAFCKQSAMVDAITDSYSLIQDNEFGEVYKKVSEALNVSLKKDLGLDMFNDPENKLKELLEETENISTGIRLLDEYTGGGPGRKQMGILSANSGGGKSVGLSNLANNYVLQGYDVAYISLELPPEMIFLRQAYIMTSFSHRVWKSKIPEIAGKIKEFGNLGVGNFRITRMPIGSNANAIRAYLKHYEIQYGKAPDVLVVDYLDLMSPIGGTKNKSLSEQDREKSQEMYEILNNYDMLGWSASQQNRDALKTNNPDQSIIAGGISKVDICDYWISMYMNSDMRLEGDMMIYMLKTRYSDAHGKQGLLHFDDASLKISDHENPEKEEDLIRRIEKNKNNKKNTKEQEVIESLIDAGEIDLPGANGEQIENKSINSRLDKLKAEAVDFSDENNDEKPENANELLELFDYTNFNQIKDS